MYILNNMVFCKKLLAKYYNNFLINYFGIKCILALFQRNYQWPDIKEEINIYIKIYKIC